MPQKTSGLREGEKGKPVQTILPPYLIEWLTDRSERDGVGKSTFIRMKLIEARRLETEGKVTA